MLDMSRIRPILTTPSEILPWPWAGSAPMKAKMPAKAAAQRLIMISLRA